MPAELLLGCAHPEPPPQKRSDGMQLLEREKGHITLPLLEILRGHARTWRQDVARHV